MTDRNNPTWEERKNQNPENNESPGSKEQVKNEETPGNRLKDGTNDLENGDENPALSDKDEIAGSTQK